MKSDENRSVPISWTPGEPMSKEFALSSIRDIRRIFRMIYYQPQADVYGCEEIFRMWLETLDGLEKYIKDNSDNRKGTRR